ncbi:MAG: aldehyde dehydrogenase family protein [Myxococcota bacterium]
MAKSKNNETPQGPRKKPVSDEKSASTEHVSAAEGASVQRGASAQSRRLEISKTYKLYINGAFVRSERGYVLPLRAKQGDVVTHYAHASRKDLRNAVQAARKVQTAWQARSAFNRSQILYRLAEMLESRKESFHARLRQHANLSAKDANTMLELAIDHVFSYAGWADKYAQVSSAQNPVSTPFFNVTMPEPTGVVVALPAKNSVLLGITALLLPIILSGNTCVLVVDNPAPTIALELAEVIATSDIPPGVVNVLAGTWEELLPHAAQHMDVNSLALWGANPKEAIKAQQLSTENVKRVQLFPSIPKAVDQWAKRAQPSLYRITPFVEWKTLWHPIGV